MDLLKTALQGFAVLAEKVSDLADGALRAYTVPGWPQPSFSPVIYLGSEAPGPLELGALRAFWTQQWADSASSACLLVPVDTMVTPRDLDGGMKADRCPLHVIVEETSLVEVTPDEVSSLHVGSLGEGRTEADFLDMVATCFPETRAAPEMVLAQLQQTGARTELIILYRGDPGKPAAASALTVRNGIAFQTWGAVPERNRGLRLSRVLQQSAIRRACELGARSSVTVTRNPRVIGTHRPYTDLWIYRDAGVHH